MLLNVVSEGRRPYHHHHQLLEPNEEQQQQQKKILPVFKFLEILFILITPKRYMSMLSKCILDFLR